MKRTVIKATKPEGFKKFLRDSAAISPVIATLILLVIAAVAAAGVGILTQKAQDNANSQTTNKDLSVIGTIKLAGASLLQEVSLGEVEAISKVYPGLTIKVGAGTGNSGRAQLYNDEIDVAASGEVWPNSGDTTFTSPDTLTGLEYKGRESAVIQGGSPTATIFEQKIGTGLIVPVANSNNVKILKINKTVLSAVSSYTASSGTLDLNYDTLGAAYRGEPLPVADIGASYDATGKLKITTGADSITLTLVQRGDKGSTHQKIFSKWLYGTGGANNLDDEIADTTTPNNAKKFNSVPDIINYIRNTPNTLGFIIWNPEATYASGIVAGQITKDAAAPFTFVEAKEANKNIGGTYDTAAKSYTSGKGLASDAYYYIQGTPKGATKAFLDFVLSGDGQKILHDNGWFSQ